jgi:hypothetical protein
MEAPNEWKKDIHKSNNKTVTGVIFSKTWSHNSQNSEASSESALADIPNQYGGPKWKAEYLNLTIVTYAEPFQRIISSTEEL